MCWCGRSSTPFANSLAAPGLSISVLVLTYSVPVVSLLFKLLRTCPVSFPGPAVCCLPAWYRETEINCSLHNLRALSLSGCRPGDAYPGRDDCGCGGRRALPAAVPAARCPAAPAAG